MTEFKKIEFTIMVIQYSEDGHPEFLILEDFHKHRRVYKRLSD